MSELSPRRPTQNSLLDIARDGSLVTILTSLLAQYVPGYSILVSFISDRLGMDGNKTLAVLGFFFGGWTAISYLKNNLIPRILESFTSSLIIDPNDSTYEDFSAWIARQRVFHFARLIKIVGDRGEQGFSPTKYAPPPPRHGLYGVPHSTKEKVEKEIEHIPDFDENVLFDYATLDSKKPLRFEPESGTYWFFHRRRLFLISRDYRYVQYSNRRSHFDPYDEGERTSKYGLRLSCVGISTQPLKDLIEQARGDNFEGRAFRTSIFRPSITTGRGERYASQDGGAWTKIGSRVSRSIDTVVLSKDQKVKILKDVNTFFHPKRHEWYAARGIPYRRGFLFSGPPGTGKTSVCYALAGVFGVDIFVASLGEGSALYENDLINLLSDLPSRCIVVLEDIDCAGAKREDDDSDSDSDSNSSVPPPPRGRRSRKIRSAISLSGLLNAIDGTGSHEGHLLVMTTNLPDTLDEALKRPGRVDMHIEFTLATRQQMREIFIRMYSDETANAPRRRNRTLQDASRESSQLTVERVCHFMPMDELLRNATTFAEHFEDATFSPAEVQGYLLQHKGSPQDALAEIGEWIPAQYKARERAKKLQQEAEERRAAKKAKLLAKRDEYAARRVERYLDDTAIPYPPLPPGVAMPYDDRRRRRADVPALGADAVAAQGGAVGGVAPAPAPAPVPAPGTATDPTIQTAGAEAEAKTSTVPPSGGAIADVKSEIQPTSESQSKDTPVDPAKVEDTPTDTTKVANTTSEPANATPHTSQYSAELANQEPVIGQQEQRRPTANPPTTEPTPTPSESNPNSSSTQPADSAPAPSTSTSEPSNATETEPQNP